MPSPLSYPGIAASNEEEIEVDEAVHMKIVANSTTTKAPNYRIRSRRNLWIASAAILLLVVVVCVGVLVPRSGGGGGNSSSDSSSALNEGPSVGEGTINDDPSEHPSFAPTSAPTPPLPTGPISFYAIGDVPYSDMESCLLPYEMDKLSASEALFLIHLGDTRDGKPGTDGNLRECPESIYENLASLLENSPVTTFYIPGDNEWFDCADTVQSYEYLVQHLVTLNERTDLGWPYFPAVVNRWTTFGDVQRSTVRPEFFSFMLQNVLFVAVSLPDAGKSTNNPWLPLDELMQDNLQWTEENLSTYSGQYEAVVIFGHSSFSNTSDSFFDGLSEIVAEHPDIPFLYMGDSHYFEETVGFRDMPNVYAIRQDDTVTPIRITVDPTKNGLTNVFQYDRRCPCSSDHRPTHVLTYDNGDECEDACTEAQNACIDEDTCSPDPSWC